MLQVGLADEERARAAWSEVEPMLDIDRLEPGTFDLLPLVYQRLRELAIAASPLPRLRGVQRKVWVENRLALGLLERALDVLADAGVPTMIVNDAYAAVVLHGDLGFRPINEVEIVIPSGAAALAARSLRDAGWGSPQPDSAAELALGSTRGLRIGDETGERELVLRSHPLVGAGTLGRRDDALWEASVEVVLEQRPTRVPAAADALLYTCVAGVGGSWPPRVQWLADVDLMVRRGDAVDWAQLIGRAEERGVLPPLRDALAYAAALLGTPVPTAYDRLMRAAKPSGRVLLADRIGRSASPLLGLLPHLLAQHLRDTQTQPPTRVAFGVGPFLRRAWALDSWWRMPVLAYRVLRRRLMIGDRA